VRGLSGEQPERPSDVQRGEPPRIARDDISGVITQLLSGEATDRVTRVGLLRRLSVAMAASARRAGAAAIASGRWITDSVVDMAPHVPVRDQATLTEHHGGLRGDDLAAVLVTTAARATGAVGVAGGLVSSLELATPPLLLTSPVQVAAETLAVVAIELKLVAELHEVYGHPAVGTPAVKTAAYLGAWTRRRALVAGPGRSGVVTTLNAGQRELRRRLLRRAGTNLTTVVPFLAGAVAGGSLNSRETKRLAQRMVRDLGGRAL
jgi:hypothetical protein